MQHSTRIKKGRTIIQQGYPCILNVLFLKGGGGKEAFPEDTDSGESFT